MKRLFNIRIIIRGRIKILNFEEITWISDDSPGLVCDDKLNTKFIRLSYVFKFHFFDFERSKLREFCIIERFPLLAVIGGITKLYFYPSFMAVLKTQPIVVIERQVQPRACESRLQIPIAHMRGSSCRERFNSVHTCNIT